MTVVNRSFDVYQGMDLIINFIIYQADGYTVSPITGFTLAAHFYQVGRTSRTTDLDKTSATGGGVAITSGAGGTGTITLTREETLDMAATEWEWDLWRTDNGSNQPLALGSFTLLETPRSRGSET